MKSTILLALAEAHCAAGEVEAGLDVVLQAEQFEQETGEARHQSSIQRVKGDLHLLNRDEEAAERAYLSALSIAQEKIAKLLELEVAKRLARLWHQQGKIKQAEKMLQPLYNWFAEGLDTPMLIEARELLEELAREGS